MQAKQERKIERLQMGDDGPLSEYKLRIERLEEQSQMQKLNQTGFSQLPENPNEQDIEKGVKEAIRQNIRKKFLEKQQQKREEGSVTPRQN